MDARYAALEKLVPYQPSRFCNGNSYPGIGRLAYRIRYWEVYLSSSVTQCPTGGCDLLTQPWGCILISSDPPVRRVWSVTVTRNVSAYGLTPRASFFMPTRKH